jgi:hypothetical protein
MYWDTVFAFHHVRAGNAVQTVAAEPVEIVVLKIPVMKMASAYAGPPVKARFVVTMAVQERVANAIPMKHVFQLQMG